MQAGFSASIQPGLSRYGNLTVVDKVPFEMLELVDDHWYQFSPMNPLWFSLLGFTMVIFTILSLAGNGVVMSVFLSTKGLRTPANLLVVNLAFSDFLMQLTMGPAMIVNCYYETWVFGNFHNLFLN
jgi:r-opsin